MFGLEYATYLCYLYLAGLGIDLSLKLINIGNCKLATAKLGKKKDFKSLLGKDGIQLSQNYQLSEKYDYEGVAIIAPTGSYKTTSHHVPNLLQNDIKGSIIINDPKGELWKLTHKYQEKIGRKTILFKPLDKYGVHYNPLRECENVREVMQLAQSLLINGSYTYEILTGKKTNSTEWLQMSQSLFTAALLYKKTTIQDALLFIINSDDNTIDETLSNADRNTRIQYNIFKTSLQSPKTMSSIKITLASALTLFTDELPISRTDFRAEDLRSTPTALYISYPENMSAYISPFMACFYSQFIAKLINLYDKNSLPITLLLDEFANLGQLNNFSQNVSTGRSRKICFDICLQSKTQLKQLYGEDNAESILNNLKTKIVLPGLSDVPTLNYISDLCGYSEVKLKDDQGHMHITSKKLFTPHEVRTLDDNKVMLIMRNKNPVLDIQNIYFKQDKYKEAANGN